MGSDFPDALEAALVRVADDSPCFCAQDFTCSECRSFDALRAAIRAYGQSCTEEAHRLGVIQGRVEGAEREREACAVACDILADALAHGHGVNGDTAKMEGDDMRDVSNLLARLQQQRLQYDANLRAFGGSGSGFDPNALVGLGEVEVLAAEIARLTAALAAKQERIEELERLVAK